MKPSSNQLDIFPTIHKFHIHFKSKIRYGLCWNQNAARELKLSRPVLVYLIMLVALIAGLWAVLAIGRHLTAPQDLAGKWQLTPLAPITSSAVTESLTVEQSGNFFQIAFERGPRLNLKNQGGSNSMLLRNSKWQVTFADTNQEDDKIISMTGQQSAQWSAHRTLRTFPPDVQSQEMK